MNIEAFKTQVKDLEGTYQKEKGRGDLRGFYKEVIQLADKIIPKVERKNLWIGLSKEEVFVEFIVGTNYQPLHRKHKTEINFLIGSFSFDSKTNTFRIFPPLSSFFVDSWHGFLWGNFFPFEIVEDKLSQKESS